MWAIIDVLSGRLALWRKVTQRRIDNHQGDLLRIEAKVDEMDFRLHRTLGELSERLDNQAITVGALAREAMRERQHSDLVGNAGELMLATIRALRHRVDQLEARLDVSEASAPDQRKISA